MRATDDRRCFVCGSENPEGMRLEFRTEAAGEASAELAVPDRYAGWSGVVHGGIVCTLLDEAMAKAAMAAGHPVATVELSVRYLAPVPTGATCRVVGKVLEVRRRLVLTEGSVSDAEGRVFATATAKMLVVARGET
ncbi:MAG: PaaI family thioesterase [Acidobacteria bacterium]|nr:PaaI family thioesterase [Acidobacteriota bacterium]